jgi:hypothetical protein
MHPLWRAPLRRAIAALRGVQNAGRRCGPRHPFTLRPLEGLNRPTLQGTRMSQPPVRLRPRLRLAVGSCQFGNCPRRGKARAISYYYRPGQLRTLRPRVCDEHFRDLPKVDGPATDWLNGLRGNPGQTHRHI